jgi:hypothetical protein
MKPQPAASDTDTATPSSLRDRIQLLVVQGRRADCLDLAFAEGFSADDANWLSHLTSEAMRSRDLWLAGEYAYLLALLRWGSPCHGAMKQRGPLAPADVFLSCGKLQHDIEQFLYLQSIGVLGAEFSRVIDAWRSIADELASKGIHGQVPLDDDARQAIGHVYNRIVHICDAPRVSGGALSQSWRSAVVERRYVEAVPGLVVIDDFLTDEALASLRRFCIESTVWSGNRYAHGRLGAFLFDGFNCPLLLQIAEELRERLPHVIGDYPLRQLWGFKNAPHLPGNSTTHADFAAVNVNIWITPTEANLDPGSGGLIVHDVDAPLDWNFDMYNSSPELIQLFLQQQAARSVTIPYRANRAIIFNSDLFHATAEVWFRPEYENRRVNVTMLYGERTDDVHHREVSRRRESLAPAEPSRAWRSQAFALARRRRA